MKKNIHPQYYPDAKIVCSCGNIIHAGSTVANLRTELCSACHPFYTGKQKHVDSAGRIEKFKKKQVETIELKLKKEEGKSAKKEKAEEVKKAKTKTKKAPAAKKAKPTNKNN